MATQTQRYSLPNEYDKGAQQLLGKILAEGLSQRELNAAYDDVSRDYDQVVLDNGYKAPKSCTDAVTKLYPEAERAQKTILDIGAGTGLLADEMQKKGFKIFDALDPSQGMLDIAKEKGVYRNYICEAVGKEPLNIPSNSYDIVTVVGSHIANHIESEALIEIIRLVKPGGIVCIVARMESLSNLDKYKDSFFPLCQKLEEEQKWRKIDCSSCPYWSKIEGVQIVYRVC
ncbi:methyltransferase-like protein 27 [Saccostrea echinata]|uniref:methyltransferase-like protein 27 n=1 Tax=Saccostrea echinata TaxID=191078 RepID=UPI002A83DA14|nr:methyltransferase-like protein 27 [Saccostrea echinata]